MVIFGIHRFESAAGAHVSPHPEFPSTFLLTPSLWGVPEHWLWVPCFMCRTWTGHLFHIWYCTCFSAILSNHPFELGLVICFTYGNIRVSMLFSQIIPPLPSPAASKSLFFTSVSLLLPCIWYHCCHLSKFHIFPLIYNIGVSLSDLLHSYNRLQFHPPH